MPPNESEGVKDGTKVYTADINAGFISPNVAVKINLPSGYTLQWRHVD
jgi:hypothetical protein